MSLSQPAIDTLRGQSPQGCEAQTRNLHFQAMLQSPDAISTLASSECLEATDAIVDLLNRKIGVDSPSLQNHPNREIRRRVE